MATKTNKSLIGLATGKSNVKKEEVEKPKSQEEERDFKAKEKVKELLQDVDLSLDKKEEILELEPTKPQQAGVEWLQEQVDLLTSENQLLKQDLAVAKADYEKLRNGTGIQDEGAIAETVRKVFHELQSNYIKMGKSPNGEPNFRIVPGAFLNRLILYFPFLQKEKRF